MTDRDQRILDWYLQVDNLARYFTISNNYIDQADIRKQVQKVFPSWTGHEDYYWYCYHYEAFGNALYSYKEAWTGLLTELLHLTPNTPDNKFLKQAGFGGKEVSGRSIREIAKAFIVNPAIVKVLNDRHGSVHEFGVWRKSLAPYLTTQNYQAIRDLVMQDILATKEIIEETDGLLRSFIAEEYAKNG